MKTFGGVRRPRRARSGTAGRPPAPEPVSSCPGRAGLALRVPGPSAASSGSEVVLIRYKARLQRVWPADPLQPRGGRGVIQAGRIAALAADQLERAGVAAFHPARPRCGRLAPEARYTRVERWFKISIHRQCSRHAPAGSTRDWQLCIDAGADGELIPRWAEVGRYRAAARADASR
jgi:hypothetical protein